MDAEPRRPPEVSARETEVLTAIGQHMTNSEIADQLFISVRTVESHVSSLLRKFDVKDRRALAALSTPPSDALANAPWRTTSHLPLPLTPFVGRAAERAALATALTNHRLVTAVGPGGIGKTRLALAVAAEGASRFADGVWYVDLVPVAAETMVTQAVADALRLGEQQGLSAEETVLTWLGEREVLLVLDNCEHLIDGVVILIERLLTACPRVTVVATSRSRLLVPHECVFAVPGMAVTADGGDAVELFLERASSADHSFTTMDRQRVARICRNLDGVALAIELAAARLPTLGLDGLEAGLDNHLHLLTGGRRLDDRHRSLRSALDWSYALLDEAQQAVLRRVSVFATPFSAEAAAALLTGWAPGGVAAAVELAGLAEHSLLTTHTTLEGTRYRLLETIRQYGAERLAAADELVEAHTRHLRWCLAAAENLCEPLEAGLDEGRRAFDYVADELLGALEWASREPTLRADAFRLANLLAELSFTRGRLGDAQRRYEQAAALAGNQHEAASLLATAASAAEIRHFGGEAIRLHHACADAAQRADDRPLAAYHLAQIAELVVRGPGLVQGHILPDVASLITKAQSLADDDPAAVARITVANGYAARHLDTLCREPADHAIDLARRAGDPLAESAALDLLTSVELARGEIRAAASSSLRRTELLGPLQHQPLTCGFELFDAYQMAAETALAAGDLAAARDLAEQVRGLPFYQEEGHLATARLLVVTALTGEWEETTALGQQFLQGWERAGRPRAGNLSRAPYAAAAVCGLHGDSAGRTKWLAVVDAIATPNIPLSHIHHGEFFDALVLLHHGRAEEAKVLLSTPPEEFQSWVNGMWRTWYASVWAEAAVLAGGAPVADRITRARQSAADNPVAFAVVERAAALAAGDRDGVLNAADTLLRAGCRYQWARTLVLAGGPERARGQEELDTMGAAPMAL